MKLVELASTARAELVASVARHPHFSPRDHHSAPEFPGVYFVLDGSEIVYVGSAGHGKGEEPGGLRRRLYRQFRRTGLSQVRQGIARDLGRPNYIPKRNSEKDPQLERKIDERLALMRFAFSVTRTSHRARRLEGLAIAVIDPRYNRG